MVLYAGEHPCPDGNTPEAAVQVGVTLAVTTLHSLFARAFAHLIFVYGRSGSVVCGCVCVCVVLWVCVCVWVDIFGVGAVINRRRPRSPIAIQKVSGYQLV